MCVNYLLQKWKLWRVKTLVNSVNQGQIAKLKPTKVKSPSKISAFKMICYLQNKYIMNYLLTNKCGTCMWIRHVLQYFSVVKPKGNQVDLSSYALPPKVHLPDTHNQLSAKVPPKAIVSANVNDCHRKRNCPLHNIIIHYKNVALSLIYISQL